LDNYASFFNDLYKAQGPVMPQLANPIHLENVMKNKNSWTI